MPANPPPPVNDSAGQPARDNTRGRLWVACALFATLGILAIGLLILENAENQRHLGRMRAEILNRLSVIRAKIEGDLTGEILLTRSLVTEFANRPDLSQERFAEIVSDFLLVSKHLRNVALARGTVIAYVYPLEANRAALGADYRTIPGQWPAVEKAILTQKTVVAGPVDLVQGGRGIISRTPVFVRDPLTNGPGRYLGIVGSVINSDSLILQSGIEADAAVMRCALRGRDGLGAAGEIIHGDPVVFREAPLLMDIQIPNGSWQLGAVPAAGWPRNSPNIVWLRLAVGLLSMAATAAAVSLRLAHERRRDIARKNLEAERRIRLTVEASGVYWWEVDRQGNTFTVDRYWFAKLLGIPSLEAVPRQPEDLRALIHPEDFVTLQKAVREHQRLGSDFFQCDVRMRRADGAWLWLLFKGRVLQEDATGLPVRAMGVCTDISERKGMEEEHSRLIGELQTALSQVRTLSGLLPICSRCKKIRDDSGYWNKIETYLSRHSQVEFSHGICPDCARTLYPEYHND